MKKQQKNINKTTKFTGYLLHKDFLEKEIEENLEMIQKFNRLSKENNRKDNK